LALELSEPVAVLGRALLGGLFVFGGVRHFFLLDKLAPLIAQRGLPVPMLLLLAGSSFQAILGLLLLLGWWVTPAALGLIAFTIAATVMLLNFWDKSGAEREGAFNAAMTNLAVIGGLLLLAAPGL